MSYKINKNKFLDETELAHMYKVLRSATPFNRLLLKLLLHTGARAQEVLNIRPEDLNLSAKTVFIRGLKGSNDRELPLPPKLFNDLLHQAQTHLTEFIFDISYQRLYQIWREHCPVKKGPHAARHTVGVNLNRKHKDLNLVKAVLGHKSIVNTMVYAEYNYTQKELRKLVLA